MILQIFGPIAHLTTPFLLLIITSGATVGAMADGFAQLEVLKEPRIRVAARGLANLNLTRVILSS